MKKFLLILFAIYANFAFSQIPTNEKKTLPQKMDTAIAEVEIIPEFPAGSKVFRNIIAENFKEDNVNGDGILTCEIVFIINKEGIIDEINTVGTNESFNTEAKKAIAQIKEKWSPATVNGVKVRYRMRIPLTLDYTVYKEQ